jgi:hypothetical protein
MQRKIIITLSVLCLLLAVLCGVLAFRLSSRQRFTVMSDKALYYMFDEKTAQACWAGPSSDTNEKASTPAEDPFLKGLGKQQPLPINNPGHIPFCKDL